MLLRRMVAGLSSLALMGLVSGCGVRPGQQVAAAGQAGFHGMVHGGQQPVSDSTLQLYTVGTSGDGSTATPILEETVRTDANGNFSLTGLYSCTGATEVYITAVGGSAGSLGDNPNLSLMTALGPCTGLTSSTFITVNEVTTVAAVEALYPYMSSLGQIGSGTADASALANAFTLAQEYANSGTGMTPGTGIPTGYVAPVAEINTLADAIAACINSTGGTSGDGSSCGYLFLDTTPSGGSAPRNTLGALWELAENPTLNTGLVFALVQPTAPFQPVLSQTPANFGVALQPAPGSATLQVSPSSLTFPSTAVGFTSAAQAVTVQNIGTVAATLSSVALSGTNASDFAVANNCGSTVAAGDSCTLLVQMTPSATGARAATLSVNSNSPGSPMTVGLSGTGGTASAGPVTLSVSTLSWTLANTLQDVVVSNYGSAPLNIRSVVATTLTEGPLNGTQPATTNVFSVVGNTCGTSLPAQSICTITVQSTLAEAVDLGETDTATGLLTITDDASTGPQTVTLNSANATLFTGGIFTASPTQVGMTQSMGGPTEEAVEHYNGGGSAAMTLGGANPGDFAVTATQNGIPLGSTYCYIEAGTSFYPGCIYTFTFTPTAAGSRSAKAYIGGSQYIQLTGTGIGSGPYFTLSSSAMQLQNYVSVADPYYGSATFSITNYGTTTFSFSDTVTGADPGAITVNASACTTLAPNTSCSVTVTANTLAIGTYNATVNVTDANSQTTHSILVTVTAGYWPIGFSPTYAIWNGTPVYTVSSATSFIVGDSNKLPLGHPISVALQPSSSFTLPMGSTCPASTTQVCTLSVAFAPQSVGSFDEVLTITDLTSGLTAQFQLGGTSVSAPGVPAVSFSPSPMVFPLRSVNTISVPTPVTLTNPGTGTLTVSSVSLAGVVNNNFSETNNCTSVAAGGTCTIEVTFAPTATGSQGVTLQVVSNAASSPNTLSITGTAQ